MNDFDEKALKAKALFGDGVFKDAVNVVKEYHTATFSRIDATDVEVMEARRMVLALTEVVNQLANYVADGEIHGSNK